MDSVSLERNSALNVDIESLLLPYQQSSESITDGMSRIVEHDSDDDTGDDVYDVVILHLSEDAPTAEKAGKYLKETLVHCFNSGIGGPNLKVHLMNEESSRTQNMPILSILKDLSERTGVFLVLVTPNLCQLGDGNQLMTGINTLLSHGAGSDSPDSYRMGVLNTSKCKAPFLLATLRKFDLDDGDYVYKRLHDLLAKNRSYTEDLRKRRMECKAQKERDEAKKVEREAALREKARLEAIQHGAPFRASKPLEEVPEDRQPTVHRYPVHLPPQHIYAHVAQIGSNNQYIGRNQRSHITASAESEVADVCQPQVPDYSENLQGKLPLVPIAHQLRNSAATSTEDNITTAQRDCDSNHTVSVNSNPENGKDEPRDLFDLRYAPAMVYPLDESLSMDDELPRQESLVNKSEIIEVTDSEIIEVYEMKIDVVPAEEILAANGLESEVTASETSEDPEEHKLPDHSMHVTNTAHTSLDNVNSVIPKDLLDEVSLLSITDSSTECSGS